MGNYTFQEIGVDEENLMTTVLEQTECVDWPKKQMFTKIGHFAVVVLIPQWFLCSGIYGIYFVFF